MRRELLLVLAIGSGCHRVRVDPSCILAAATSCAGALVACSELPVEHRSACYGTSSGGCLALVACVRRHPEDR